MHNVDEGKMTTVHQSGHWNSWNESEAAGLMCRDLYDSPTEAWDIAASSNIQKYEIIRMFMMSTKTM